MDPKNFMNIEKALVGLGRLKDWFEPWPLTYGLALFLRDEAQLIKACVRICYKFQS